jgi:hypothetical protein
MGKQQKIENVSQQIILWLEESNDPFLEIRGTDSKRHIFFCYDRKLETDTSLQSIS